MKLISIINRTIYHTVTPLYVHFRELNSRRPARRTSGSPLRT
jgi:hypothetical protein